MKICPTCSREFGSELGFCPHDGSALQSTSFGDDLVSQVIADRYRVLKRIGQGGMGEVYLAEHVKMGRRCAIKILNRSLTRDPGAANRFGREAAHASSINHPNVVSTFDFGETEDGLLYIAMEYVDGESLAALLRREGSLPVPRAVGIVDQIAQGLGAAHHLGIVHRDLKPDNILLARALDGGDLAKLGDFGVAKALRQTETHLTHTGFALGTPHYMSPEQLIAEPVDGRSDIYSLGCCLYEMLVGEKVFADTGEMSFSRRLTEDPPRPSQRNRQVSRALDSVVLQALARMPGDRFQTVAQFRDALAATTHQSGGFASLWLVPWRTRNTGAHRGVEPGAAVTGGTPSRGFTPFPVERWKTTPTPPGIPATSEAPVASPSAELAVAVNGSAFRVGRRTKMALGATATVAGMAALATLSLGTGSESESLTFETVLDEARRGRVEAVQLAIGRDGRGSRLSGRIDRFLGFNRPFSVESSGTAVPEAVSALRAAGVADVDVAEVVAPLLEELEQATAQRRWWTGNGNDVATITRRILDLDPANGVAAAELEKLPGRLGVAAVDSLRAGALDPARELARKCLELRPAHVECTQVVGTLQGS
jgi:hypothetical protein